MSNYRVPMPSFSKKRYSFMGILLTYVWLILIAAIFTLNDSGSDGGQGAWWFLGGVVGILGLTIATYQFQKLALKRHDLRVKKQALDNGWEYSAVGTVSDLDSDMVLALLVSDDDSTAELRNYVEAGEWQYYDYLYNFYQRYKHGRVKAGERSYALISVKLPRQLPNVLFDSVRSNRKQFDRVFAHNQKISLEGNFDAYFTTYFPESYRVDSLSFITPEVMEALIRAAEYDVEIIHDKLYLFAPIGSGDQVIDISNKAMDIKKTLLNNILTYRDERLPYEQGRTSVTPQMSKLRRSKWPVYVTTAVTIAYVVFTLIMQFRH